MIRALAARLRGLVHLEGPPWRIALALAVGVFISFTPLWGVQTVLALVVAAVFRLNAPAVVAGTWINLPWFAPFVYAGAVQLGARLLPRLHGLHGVSTWLVVGTTIFGVAAGAVTYLVALGVIRARRGRRGADGSDTSRRRAA